MDDLESKAKSVAERIRSCKTQVEVIDAFFHGLELDEDLLSDISCWLEHVEREVDYLLGYMQTAFKDQGGFDL